MKLKHTEKEKLLWVADSISFNVDFNLLTKKSKLAIKAAKATVGLA